MDGSIAWPDDTDGCTGSSGGVDTFARVSDPALDFRDPNSRGVSHTSLAKRVPVVVPSGDALGAVRRLRGPSSWPAPSFDGDALRGGGDAHEVRPLLSGT